MKYRFASRALVSGMALLAFADMASAQMELTSAEPMPARAEMQERKYTRVSMPPLDQMSEEQRQFYDHTVAFFGAPTGPTIAFIHAMNINKAWRDYFSEVAKSELPRDLWEISILVVARSWDAPVEWYMHEKWSREANVPEGMIEAIRNGTQPQGANEAQLAIYRFTDELQNCRKISDATYAAARDAIGQQQLIELTALIGHYNKVAIMLNAHDSQLPDGASVSLPALGMSRCVMQADPSR